MRQRERRHRQRRSHSRRQCERGRAVTSLGHHSSAHRGCCEKGNLGQYQKLTMLPDTRSKGIIQVPDDQRLVTRTRQEHVGVLKGGSKTLYTPLLVSPMLPITLAENRISGEHTVTHPL